MQPETEPGTLGGITETKLASVLTDADNGYEHKWMYRDGPNVASVHPLAAHCC